MIPTIRGLIYSTYKSEAAFARVLGWTRQRLNVITSGKRRPTVDEVNALAVNLNHPLEEVVQIFLSDESPNEQQP